MQVIGYILKRKGHSYHPMTRMLFTFQSREAAERVIKDSGLRIEDLEVVPLLIES